MRSLRDDWGDGIDANGGSPRVSQKNWCTVTWQFPANAPAPDHFEIAIYTGTDPTDTTQYLLPIQIAPATDLKLIVAISPNVAVANVNAAVRSVYV